MMRGVERIAGDADACAAQRGEAAGGARAEAEDGEVAGAAAEVADQDDGFGVERAGEAIAGALWLERGVEPGDAGFGERGAEAALAEGIIGILAGKADRAAGDDMEIGRVEGGRSEQLAQETGRSAVPGSRPGQAGSST